MPQTSTLGEPSAPLAEPAAPHLVVAFPDAQASRRFWALQELTSRLTSRLAASTTAVCWQTGPFVRAIRASTVIDAGSVNDRLLPRALAGLRLRPVARGLKSTALRRLLEPVGDHDQVLLGGASTLPLLDWLPSRPRRRVVVWVGDDELEQLDAVLAVADLVLAGGPRVVDALVAWQLDPSRWRTVAEPLVEAPEEPTPAVRDDRRHVLLIGGADGVAAAAAAVIAATQSEEAGPAAPTWLHISETDRDGRWADARFDGLGSVLGDALIEDRPPIADIAAVVLAGPTPATLADASGPRGTAAQPSRSPLRLAATAALAGVPVLGLGTTEALVHEAGDAPALRDRLHGVLSDPSTWANASIAAVARAQPHRIDLATSAITNALGRSS